MATTVRKGGAFVWSGDARRERVRNPGFSEPTELADNRRHWRNLHNCELLQECLNADLLDDFEGEHYELNVAGSVVDAPDILEGTGITITVDGSNVTINAANNGDVTGPASSTQDALAAFIDTTGKELVNTGITTGGDNNDLKWPGETTNTPSNVNLSANAQEDDYTGFNGMAVVHVTELNGGGGGTTITGITGGVEGRYLEIWNFDTGGNTLTLDDDTGGASAAANRIVPTSGGTIPLVSGEFTRLRYINSRWRQV